MVSRIFIKKLPVTISCLESVFKDIMSFKLYSEIGYFNVFFFCFSKFYWLTNNTYKNLISPKAEAMLYDEFHNLDIGLDICALIIFKTAVKNTVP